MVVRSLVCVSWTAMVLLTATAPAWAQTSRGSTSSRGTSGSSMFGDRTLGGGIQSNAQSAQQGASGAPQVGNGDAVAQSQEGAGTVSGDERFLRENRQGAFVGADTGDTVNLRSQMTGAGQQNFGNLFQNLFGNSNISNDTGRSNTQLRIPIKLGFAPRPIQTARVATGFTARLARLPEFHASGPIVVSMDGRTAVLQGVVASEADRQLAEKLVMLEPAVRAVRNELVVDPAATTEEIPLPVSPSSATPGLP